MHARDLRVGPARARTLSHVAVEDDYRDPLSGMIYWEARDSPQSIGHSTEHSKYHNGFATIEEADFTQDLPLGRSVVRAEFAVTLAENPPRKDRVLRVSEDFSTLAAWSTTLTADCEVRPADARPAMLDENPVLDAAMRQSATASQVRAIDGRFDGAHWEVKVLFKSPPLPYAYDAFLRLPGSEVEVSLEGNDGLFSRTHAMRTDIARRFQYHALPRRRN